MGINYVNLANGEDLIDLRNDTVSEDTLYEGITAHNAQGERIIGNMSRGGDMFKSIYDTDDNGQVDRADDAEKLGGKLPEHYATKGEIPTVPTALSQLSQDATHRVVTDTEKATWNAKSNLTASKNGYNGAITTGSDGVAEMGKYIDFHNTSSGTSDYSTRFVCTGDYQNTVNLPSVAGTLVVGDNAYKIVKASSAPTTNNATVITFVV